MPLLRFFNVANMSFNAIRDNKILTKIPEFTVVIRLKRLWLIKGLVGRVLRSLMQLSE